MTCIGTGGVLAAVGRKCWIQYTIWTGLVFLSASGTGLSMVVAVGTLGVSVYLDASFDVEPFCQEEEIHMVSFHFFGVDRNIDGSGFLHILES